MRAITRLRRMAWVPMRFDRKPHRFILSLACGALVACAMPAFGGSGTLPFPSSGAGFVREALGTGSPSSLDLPGPFTVEAWINPASVGTYPILSASA